MYNWEIDFETFQFYVEVYQRKSFNSSTLLFQLEDRVSVKYNLLSVDKLDHRNQMVPYIG